MIRSHKRRAGGSAGGQLLIDEINAVRAVQALPPLAAIPLAAAERPARCPVSDAAACTLAPGLAPEWNRRVTLHFPCSDLARMAGHALHQPYNEETCETLAPPTICSFRVAASWGLTFSEGGELRGWLDPAGSSDPSLWRLHLAPGQAYPPGHRPPRPHEIVLATIRAACMYVGCQITAALRTQAD
jgi:hypothetical protein